MKISKPTVSLSIRVTPEDKVLFQRAAVKNNMTLTAWLVASLRISAKCEGLK